MDKKELLQNRLSEAMSACRIKAVELSQQTGIPKGAISYYLSGKSNPKSDRVHLLAKALGVSEAWLLGYDVPKNRTAEQKKNDSLVKVIAQLRSDPEFFNVVSLLAELPPEQYASVKTILSALGNK